MNIYVKSLINLKLTLRIKAIRRGQINQQVMIHNERIKDVREAKNKAGKN